MLIVIACFRTLKAVIVHVLNAFFMQFHMFFSISTRHKAQG